MDCDSLILKLPSYFSSCKILDLAVTVTQTKNNLKSWFNVYFDKYCHKSIQKFKTVTENKRNFLFEFRAIFSFCSADILFFTPHLSLETLETKTQPTHNIPSFNDQQVNNLAPKQLRNFGSANYSFWKNPTFMTTPQQPEFWLHPIIGPRLWS